MNLTFGVPLAEPAVMPAKTILKMATEGGQVCLGGRAGLDGAIRPGARADIIGLDKNRIYLAAYGQIANTILEECKCRGCQGFHLCRKGAYERL